MYRWLIFVWAVPCLAQGLESRLIEQLRDSEPAARQAAVEVLGGLPQPGAFEALLAACHDPCARVRCAVAATLAAWPWEAGRAAAALREMLADEDAGVVRSVCWQLRRHPEVAGAAAAQLRALLAQPGMFPAVAPLLPPDVLRAELPRVRAALAGQPGERAAAARALARLGDAGREQHRRVLALLNDDVGEVREAAWQAVHALALAPSAGVRLQGLADPHAGARLAALQSLGPGDCMQPGVRPRVAQLTRDPACAALARRLLRGRLVWGIVGRSLPR